MKLLPTDFAGRASLIIGAWVACLGAIFAISVLGLSWWVEREIFSSLLEAESEAFREADSHANKVWVPGAPGVEGADSIAALGRRLPPSFDPGRPGPQIVVAEDGRDVRAIALDPELGERSRIVMMDTSQVLDRQQRVNRYIGLVGLAALFVLLSASAVSYFAGRQIALPVKRLSRLLSGSSGGPVPAGFAATFGPGELGHVAGVLEHSLVQTQQALEREKTFNAGLSHELRSGLQAAEHAVELLRLGPRPKARDEILNRLDRALLGMKDASEAVLWLARGDHPPAIPLTAAIRHTMASLERLAGLRHVRLEFESDGELVAEFPAEVVAVVLSNLVRNAIHHANTPLVRVSVGRTGFAVRDFGRGLTEAQRAAIERGHGIPDASGAGLGLVLCRRLVERFNGSLAFRFPEDGGVEVFVDLSGGLSQPKT